MITRVGDSLLTLPQYLDPLSSDNIKFSLVHTQLQFLTESSQTPGKLFLQALSNLLLDEENTEDEIFERNHGASAWLCAAGNGACSVFIKVGSQLVDVFD